MVVDAFGVGVVVEGLVAVLEGEVTFPGRMLTSK